MLAVKGGSMQLALATRGRAPAADPPPKSFTLLVFSRFWWSRAGKDEAKTIRCFWNDFRPFWSYCLTIFGCEREATTS